MKLTTLREIFTNSSSFLDKEVSIGGWVRSNRDSKAFGFLMISDGTFFEQIQIVYHDSLDNFSDISKVNVGAALVITGKLVATPNAKQAFEVQATQITIEGPSSSDYPLQKKRHTLEYLRSIQHLRPRTNTFQAVYRVRSLIAFAIHEFFRSKDFIYVHTPIITGSDTEGAGEMFQVTTLPVGSHLSEDGKVDYSKDFFGKEISLTVSGQLCGEVFAQAFRNNLFDPGLQRPQLLGVFVAGLVIGGNGSGDGR